MSHAQSPTRRAGFSALKIVFADGRYRDLFLASTGTMASQWMQRIAMGWLIWELTNSGVWLGALAIAELAPGLVLGPLGGVWADRFDRRKIVLLCQIVAFLQSLATGGVILFGLASPLLLVALAGVSGSAAAAQEAARSLLVRDVTPKDCLPTGMSLVAISVNVTRFLGPAMAGPIMAWAGPAPVFWINAAVALVLIAVVLGLREIGQETRAGKGGFVTELWQGVVAAATHRVVTPVLIVFAATALIIRPLYELMPAFADRLFGGGVQDYSYLVMAVGLGAIGGALVVTLHAPDKPARMFMGSSVGACGALLGFGLSPNLTAALAAAAVLGFFMCMSAATSQLVVIMDAEDATSGRVLSLWGAMMRGFPAIGALVMGVVIDLLGYRWPLLICAVLCAVIVGTTIAAARRRLPPQPASGADALSAE